MAKEDDILKALDELTQRLDRMERKIDFLGNNLLSPLEQKQAFSALSERSKPDPRNR